MQQRYSDLPKQKEQEEILAIKDPVFDEKQAQLILAETEIMVRDLLDKARFQVQEILKQAHDESEQIKQLAREESSKIKENSRQEGYKDGKSKAIKEMDQTRRTILDEARVTLEQAQKEREEMLNEVEPQVLQLAVSIARKVICRELTSEPESIKEIVREALLRAKGTGELVIKVHESFCEPLSNNLTKIIPSSEGHRKYRVEADDTVEPGGCIVVTSAGYIDAQITSQLEKVEESLKQARVYG
jgi:flagellar assembly protein FliH